MGQYWAHLCSMPMSAWVEECNRLLPLGLGDEDKSEVLHFLAVAKHADRRPREALAACEEALPLSMPVERRAMLLENRATCLLDLGLLDPAKAVVAEIDGLPLDESHRKTPGIRAHAVMLRAMCLAGAQPEAAIAKMMEAADAFQACGETWRDSWARHSAARLTVSMGQHERALGILESVQHPEWATAAALLRAEVSARKGEPDPLKSSTVLQGDLTSAEKGHVSFIRALELSQQPNTLANQAHMSWLLEEAAESLASDTKLDLLLLDAVNHLRNELFGGRECV